MKYVPTPDAVRLLAGFARLADGHLVRMAARNAADSVYAVRARDLENARTMRDLLAVTPRSPGDDAVDRLS